MRDFIYEDGWGAFVVLLFFHIPFLIFFCRIVYKKAFVNTGPSGTAPEKYPKIEIMWISTVAVLFILVNVLSVVYMPPVSTAALTKSGTPFQEVDITAKSWYYDMSSREVEVGVPVNFSAKSGDTVHGFSVYHPDGRIVFTMMLMPGMESPTTLVHTFEEPGEYKVRCLEYCGIVHHAMQDLLVVR